MLEKGHLKRFNTSHIKFSRSECPSPLTSIGPSIFPSPVQKHSCSPTISKLKPKKISGPRFDLAVSRFDEIFIPKFYKKLTQEEILQISKRIKYNKDNLKIFTCDKFQHLKISAKKNNFRGEITRIAKISIAQSKQKSIQKDLDLKQINFDNQVDFHEIKKIKQA